MRPFPILKRASVAHLMALIVVLAVGLGAMRSATQTMNRVVYGLAMMALLVGTLGAIVRRRAGSWIGFAFFGWFYALATIAPSVRAAINADWLVYTPIEVVLDLIHPSQDVTPPQFGSDYQIEETSDGPSKWVATGEMNVGSWVALTPAEATTWADYKARVAAEQARKQVRVRGWSIGHAFLGLAFALVGAAIGQVFQQPPRRRPATP